MQKILTAAEMREVDRLTTETYGIPSILLMENAANAVARVIAEKLGGSVRGKSVLILCGKGNNGGDGAALGRILAENDAEVKVELFGDVSDTAGDARVNFEKLQRETPPGSRLIEIRTDHDFEVPDLASFDIVVDALFGTGLSRKLEGFFGRLTETLANWKNTHKLPYFISVDIPSGLSADSAEPPGDNIEADATVTFTAPKAANVLPPASRSNGELIVADIGSPRELIDAQPSQLYLAEKQDAADWLRETAFSPDSYKNKRGHSLVIAGSREYSGAAVLAGNSAMRSGVGLVTLVTPVSSKESVSARILPEVMVCGASETESGALAEEAFNEIAELLQKADSIAIGSGLSQNDSTKRFVEKVVFGADVPVIVDADALNLLSPFEMQKPAVADARASALILTPHEGEFRRLLGEEGNHPAAKAAPLPHKDGSFEENAPGAIARFQEDRVAAVREFALKHNVILVLKGERVLIGEPGGRVVVNPTGNAGLGKAGNGDTLTGIIAGFAAQAHSLGADIFETVVAAVYVAGLAADIAEEKFGKRVMSASDVRESLSEAIERITDE